MAIIERTDREREVQLMRELMEAEDAHHELFPDASELGLGEDCTTTVLTVDYFERICETEERLELLTRELEEVRARLYASQTGGVR
jgi:hypothetical protein